jgi:hypothetical protein
MSAYGLPEPDHEPLSAHPSVSADFLAKAGSGDIHVLPAIARLDGHTVHLVDGRAVEADVIVCATGYEMRFPFFDETEVGLHPDSEHRFPLFKRMIKPGVEHLYFMGLAQASPTIVNLAEQQSKLLAKLLVGDYVLPDVEAQEQIMRADEAEHLRRSPAHHPDRLRTLLPGPDAGDRRRGAAGPRGRHSRLSAQVGVMAPTWALNPTAAPPAAPQPTSPASGRPCCGRRRRSTGRRRATVPPGAGCPR